MEYHLRSPSLAPELFPLYTHLCPIPKFCLRLMILFLSLNLVFALDLSDADFWHLLP